MKKTAMDLQHTTSQADSWPHAALNRTSPTTYHEFHLAVAQTGASLGAVDEHSHGLLLGGVPDADLRGDRVVVARHRLGQHELPGGAGVALPLQHLPAVGVCVEGAL